MAPGVGGARMIAVIGPSPTAPTTASGCKASSTGAVATSAQRASHTTATGSKARSTGWASTPTTTVACTRESSSTTAPLASALERGKQAPLCGRWKGDKLVQSCPVLRRVLPFRSKLSELQSSASLLYPDGGCFVGPLDVEDRLHGRGVLLDAYGKEFAGGEWKKGEQHGIGWRADEVVCRGNDDGSRYEGEFAAGKPHGLGVKWSKEGGMERCGRWEGVWLAQSCPVPLSFIPVGALLSVEARQANLLLPDRRFYVGSVVDGLPHGKGVAYYCSDGRECFSGTWQRGYLHGTGCWKELPDGSRFSGEFVDGILHGKGKAEFLSGNVSEGEWQRGRMHGLGMKWDKQGKLTHCGRWKAAELVETSPVPRSRLPFGSKLSGLQRGASLLYADGGCFVGPLDEDRRPHGRGVMYATPAEPPVEGVWQHDQKIAAVLLADNAYHQGPLDGNGRPHGKGAVHAADGSLLREACWHHGVEGSRRMALLFGSTTTIFRNRGSPLAATTLWPCTRLSRDFTSTAASSPILTSTARSLGCLLS